MKKKSDHKKKNCDLIFSFKMSYISTAFAYCETCVIANNKINICIPVQQSFEISPVNSVQRLKIINYFLFFKQRF